MHTGQLFPAVCFWKNLIAVAVKYWFSLTSVEALIILLRLNNLSNKIFYAFLGFLKWSHTHTFLSHCLTLPRLRPCLPPTLNLWLLLLLFRIAWAWFHYGLREAQRWWSWKLTRQLFLWWRLLFVERVEKWRSPRTRWKNRENVPASANEIQANFLLITKRFLIQEMFDCIVYSTFDVGLIR